MRHFYEVTSNPGNKLTFKELLIGTTITIVSVIKKIALCILITALRLICGSQKKR